MNKTCIHNRAQGLRHRWNGGKVGADLPHGAHGTTVSSHASVLACLSTSRTSSRASCDHRRTRITVRPPSTSRASQRLPRLSSSTPVSIQRPPYAALRRSRKEVCMVQRRARLLPPTRSCPTQHLRSGRRASAAPTPRSPFAARRVNPMNPAARHVGSISARACTARRRALRTERRHGFVSPHAVMPSNTYESGEERVSVLQLHGRGALIANHHIASDGNGRIRH